MPPPSLTEPRPLALRAGDQPIPGFRLVRRRGRGGFGEVWEAEAPGRFLVALKFVRLSARARAAELRALDFVRGIHHPNLLANFGSWQVEDTLVIGMELADRSLWDRYIEAADGGLRGIPRAELLGYLGDVAAGIGHLNDYRHTLDGRANVGIQHRDLKPSNILLFGGGAKVADLGMARAMEGEVAGHTGIWTFAYAAPEFFRGQTNRQSDQYGLAATYCQLRGGRLPFEGGAASVTAGHLFGEPDLGALPEPERPIVGRALAKAPGDRWPDCRAFVEALRAIPAADVPDVLVEPADTDDIPRALRSSTGPDSGAGPILGFETGTGWRESDPTGLLPSSGPATGREPAPPASFAPWTDEAPGAPDPADTRILPATSPTPESPGSERATPGPGGRAARIGRRAAAASLTALALATSGVQAPSRTGHPPAAPPTRPALVVADGFGRSAESPPDPEPPAEEPTPMPLPPGPGRPPGAEVRPAPAPVPPPEVDLPPVPPGDGADRLGPALEGPIGPDPRVLDPLVPLPAGPRRPRPPAEEPPATAAPEVAPPKPAPPEGPPAGSPSAPAPAPAPAPDRPGPGSARAAYDRGMGLLDGGSFTRAVAEFDEALRLDPGNAAGYYNRAVARHRSGSPMAALEDYGRAIRLRPENALAYIARGQAHHELGSYARAIADLDEAIRLRPEHADAHLRRGLARFRSGDLAGSIFDFDEAIRLEPGQAKAAGFRADALAQLGARPGPAPAPGGSPPVPSATLPVATADPRVAPAKADGGPISPAARPATAPVAYGAAPRANPAPTQPQARNPAKPAANPAPPDRRRNNPGRGLLPGLFRRSR